jgi:hypothetical protein
MRIQLQLFITTCSLVLVACQGVNPVADTARYVLKGADSNAIYQQGFEYLQVQIDGRQAAMALGLRRSDGRSTHEYWYSGQREMMYLQNGRIQQVMGMTHEVRDQSPHQPDWDVLLQSRSPYAWERTMDVQPGYRYGVKEFLVTKGFEPTSKQQDLLARPGIWFEELVTGKTDAGRTWSYRQVFALVNRQVVYSEQCVSPEVCFRLRYLGVVKP